MTKILENLGFKCKKDKKNLKLIVPSWRPDISQDIDIVEELVRISGYDKINIIDPIKERSHTYSNSKVISFFTKINCIKRIFGSNHVVIY